jgi:hypothetical protein
MITIGRPRAGCELIIDEDCFHRIIQFDYAHFVLPINLLH